MVSRGQAPPSDLPRDLLWWIALLALVAPWWIGLWSMLLWVLALIGN